MEEGLVLMVEVSRLMVVVLVKAQGSSYAKSAVWTISWMILSRKFGSNVAAGSYEARQANPNGIRPCTIN